MTMRVDSGSVAGMTEKKVAGMTEKKYRKIKLLVWSLLALKTL
jgi:hypothetical protein